MPFLDAMRLFDAAACETGLGGLADAGMRQRFETLVAGFNINGPIADDKLAAAEADFVTLVANRLMLERDWRDYPEIAREEIVQPIFIVGNPRTGTTILQCLLAQDPGNAILHYWQSHYPSPPPGLAPEGVTARIARTDALVRELLEIMPGMLPCHPYLDQGGLSELEDEELFTLDFHSTFPFHFLHVPTTPVGANPTDPVAAFRFHRRMLQHLQWRAEPRRWVCKGTTHQFNLSALWEVYPDAICIWPHRDPAVFLGSLLEMIQVLYSPMTGKDYHAMGPEFVEGLAAGFEYLSGMPEIDDPRLIHLRFSDFIRDQTGTIRGVYERFDIPICEQFERGIADWQVDPQNRSDRHGRFDYRLEDFGVAAADVAEMFPRYRARFRLV